ncbi:MAG: SurA N-terminal domain-containing protein [Deltaproteobacteria bacterium]|nr:SurA N-terminal domain-containing protein [Deltaproteobacteria bacterium]
MSIQSRIALTIRRFLHLAVPDILLWTLALWAVILFPCGCQRDDASRAVATVNDERITLGEFRERLTGALSYPVGRSSLNPEDEDRLREEVLNHLIDEKIMLSRAAEMALTVSDAEVIKKIEEIKEGYSTEGFEKVLAEQRVHFDAWKKALKKRMILEKLIASDVNAGISVTEEEVRAFYHTHRKEYAPEKKVHIAQIVLRDHELSGKILNRLKSGEDFGKVAREVSIGLEAARGGDLGFVGRGIMPEAIDNVIFSLPPGAISQVIKSPYGYHIFKIIEKEERRREFSDIKERVMSDMRKQKEEEAYILWLSSLRSRASVKIDRGLLKLGTVTGSRQAE